MKAKEVIAEYLKTHETFCFAEISIATGVPVTAISQAANRMFRAGELVVDKKVWRTVWYRLPDDAERAGKVSTNLIFKECRNSEAMKRVLMVYGRAV